MTPVNCWMGVGVRSGLGWTFSAHPPTFSDLKKNFYGPNPLNWAEGLCVCVSMWNVLGTKNSFCEGAKVERAWHGEEADRKPVWLEQREESRPLGKRAGEAQNRTARRQDLATEG